MRTSRIRRSVPLVAAGLTLLLAAQPAMAAVTWKAPAPLSGLQRNLWAEALARTSSPDRSRLHLVATTERVGGEPVTDSGPYQGIEYRRSNDGVHWSDPRRLNAKGEHGNLSTVAAAGKRVYVAWLAQTHIQDHFIPADPRPIKLVVNDDHGDPGAWRSRVTLIAGRADKPAIAATGRRVYVAYTDASTGEIRVLRSTDRARTWDSKAAIGATVSGATGDYSGLPVIAADGKHVVVAFRSDNGLNLRRSTDGGDTWTSLAISETTSTKYAVAVRGDRIGVAYLDETGGRSRVRAPGGWQDWRPFTAFGSGETYYEPVASGTGSSAPAIELFGSTGLAVAWAACTDQGCPASETQGSSVRYRESTTNGTTWKAAKTVGSFAAGDARRWNSSPSLLIAGSTRYVAWMAIPPAPDANDRRILVRRGIGSP